MVLIKMNRKILRVSRCILYENILKRMMKNPEMKAMIFNLCQSVQLRTNAPT